ncbi:MAG: DUF3786 domain-containing protein [Desulfobacteraceae bacterium]|nr:MAG: DUF3786 domain-containing protein [Desulfobacteraceae bacterium]
MPRIDDYRAAIRLAREKLAAAPFEQTLTRSGFEAAGEGLLRVPFLDRVYRVRHPGFDFLDEADPVRDVPLQEQVLLLHYLLGAGPPAAPGEWVAYREIPGAGFYFSAFVKRAVDPLKNRFGRDPDAFRSAAGRLGGGAVATGDAGFEFRVLPYVSLQLILYAADDEFPAEATILFERQIAGRLSPEDIAWLAGMLVYRLIALSRTPPAA